MMWSTLARMLERPEMEVSLLQMSQRLPDTVQPVFLTLNSNVQSRCVGSLVHL